MAGSATGPYSERELTPECQHPEAEYSRRPRIEPICLGKKSICNILTIKKMNKQSGYLCSQPPTSREPLLQSYYTKTHTSYLENCADLPTI